MKRKGTGGKGMGKLDTSRKGTEGNGIEDKTRRKILHSFISGFISMVPFIPKKNSLTQFYT